MKPCATLFGLLLGGASGENFEHPHVYQTYAQFKGPLGHWNVLAGRLPETAGRETVELPNRVLPGIPLANKRRLGLDATVNDGPSVWRSEAVLGRTTARS